MSNIYIKFFYITILIILTILLPLSEELALYSYGCFFVALIFSFILFSFIKENNFESVYLYLLISFLYLIFIFFFGPTIDKILLNKLIIIYSCFIIPIIFLYSCFPYEMEAENIKNVKTYRLVFLLIISLLLLFLVKYLPSLGSVGLGLALLFNSLSKLLFFFLISYLILSKTKLALFFLLAYMSINILNTIGVDGFSRFSILSSLLLFAAIFSLKTSYRVLNLLNLLIFILFMFLFSFIFDFEKVTNMGGDVLLLENASLLIDKVDQQLSYEPLMFIFNLGFNLIPDFLFPFEKPVLFNVNSWFILNIMGIDPSAYKWGVGVGGIPAGYLFAGFVGVISLGFFSGGMLLWLKRQTNLYFGFRGVYIYYLTLLPIGFFRLDPSFFFGNLFFDFIFLLLIRKYVTKWCLYE